MPLDPIRSKRVRRVLLGMALVLIPSFSAYFAYRSQTAENGATAPAPAQETSKVPLLAPRPVTLVPGIHLLGGVSPAAAYVVETSAGLVLIDSGLEPEAQQVKENMAALQLDWRKICAVLLTHGHGDHSGGAAFLRRAAGARVHAGAEDAPFLRAGGPRDAFYSVFHVPKYIHPIATPVDVELHGDEMITFGDTVIRVLATPGHTPGSICYLMDRGDNTVLFSGDVIMSLEESENAASPFDRPLGTYAAYLAPRFRGDARAFLKTVRMLRALPAPQLILPGHPRNSPVPVSPTMTAERWNSLLDAGIQEMEHLLYRFEEGSMHFLDDEPKRLAPDIYYFGDLHGKAVYGVFSDSEFVLVNSPGGGGMSEFLSARMRSLGLNSAKPSVVLLTSINADQVSGLADLMGDAHCRVAVPAAARTEVERLFPTGTKIVAVEDWAKEHRIDLTAKTIQSGGQFSACYQLHLHHKNALFTNELPIKPVHAAQRRGSPAVAQARAHAVQTRQALDQLHEMKPDLWLPAAPVDGQNADMAAGEWSSVLEWNEDLLR
jgi:glyoxylase-like metal-dependent hydrolase (beta-lactamase superfamily II)